MVVKAKQIMTADVVTVAPGTKIDAVAKQLVNHRISALPVVTDNGELVGLVSESDMLHRAETQTTRKRKWWLEIFIDNRQKAREFIKSHSHDVDDVMSRVVVTVSPETELTNVANILDVHKIRRVPVVQDGKLIGIISRSDLVRALARAETEDGLHNRSDYALRKTIIEEIRKQSWLNSVNINLNVSEGIVEILGFVDTDEEKDALSVLVKGENGVKKVISNVKKQNWKTAS